MQHTAWIAGEPADQKFKESLVLWARNLENLPEVCAVSIQAYIEEKESAKKTSQIILSVCYTFPEIFFDDIKLRIIPLHNGAGAWVTLTETGPPEEIPF